MEHNKVFMGLFARSLLFSLLLVIYINFLPVGEIKASYKQSDAVVSYTPLINSEPKFEFKPQKMSVESTMRNILLKHGYSDSQISIFIEIARAESGLRPDAIGYYITPDGSRFVGLFQIWTNHSFCNHLNLYSVEGNTECANIVYKRRGNFSAWQVCESKVNCNF